MQKFQSRVEKPAVQTPEKINGGGGVKLTHNGVNVVALASSSHIPSSSHMIIYQHLLQEFTSCSPAGCAYSPKMHTSSQKICPSSCIILPNTFPSVNAHFHFNLINSSSTNSNSVTAWHKWRMCVGLGQIPSRYKNFNTWSLTRFINGWGGSDK